jgi:hypothetical protein
MSSRLAVVRRQVRTELTHQQRRGVRVLAVASIVCLVGVSVTGLWQFFMHESDRAWYGYVAGGDAQLASSPSTGVADLHGQFAAALAIVALFGGAWFAYRVLYDVPWLAVVALVLVTIGLITGSVIRFNVVKLRGREYEQADRGYLQLFGGDLEFVATARRELGPLAIRLWTLGHLSTVPILLAVIWFGIGRSEDAES